MFHLISIIITIMCWNGFNWNLLCEEAWIHERVKIHLDIEIYGALMSVHTIWDLHKWYGYKYIALASNNYCALTNSMWIHTLYSLHVLDLLYLVFAFELNLPKMYYSMKWHICIQWYTVHSVTCLLEPLLQFVYAPVSCLLCCDIGNAN